MQSSAGPSWTYDGELVRVVDGDTVVMRISRVFIMDVDFGFHMVERILANKSAQLKFRLGRINAPEIATPAGVLARDALVHILGTATHIKVTTGREDKYGRWLAQIDIETADGPVDVNQRMLVAGFAVLYTG